jgi:putative membrane protein
MRTVTQCAALVVAGLFLARAAADDRKPVVTDKIPTDQEFLAKALEGNILEVQLGEKARDKTSNDRVKKFAKRMIDDHSKGRQELMDIAKDMKIGVAAGLSLEYRELLFRLTKANGTDFDRAYMNHMVEDHEKDVAEFENYAKHGKNDRLREFARKTLPTLREHLRMARDVAGDLKK